MFSETPHIDDCHKTIQEQCDRLARQIQDGKDTRQSSHILHCLKKSLDALENSKAAFERAAETSC
jgi:hypothetical protein